MVGHQGEQHAAVGLGILVLAVVTAIIKLVVLHKDVSASGRAADITVGHINHAVIDAEGLVLAILVELIALDIDVVHLASNPQSSTIVAVVVVGYDIVSNGDIGAHTQVEIGNHGILHITLSIVYIHEVSVVDFHGMTYFIFPPETLVLLQP